MEDAKKGWSNRKQGIGIGILISFFCLAIAGILTYQKTDKALTYFLIAVALGCTAILMGGLIGHALDEGEAKSLDQKTTTKQ